MLTGLPSRSKRLSGAAIPLADSLQKVAELKEIYESSEEMKNLLDTASAIEGGAIRNVGHTHAAG